MKEIDLIESITPEQLSEVLQAAGYRVNRTEQNGVVQLLSASQGIGYAVRFGNPAAESGTYLDYTFSCALRIQGELPSGLAEQWNISRRFARVSLQGEFPVMEMDRSEEHTSELQSRENLVCRLLLAKKKVSSFFTSSV